MQRWVVIAAVVVLGCKKETSPPAASTGSARAGDAAIAQLADAATADAAPAHVDLGRAVLVTMHVSSRVVNATMKLEHLVDRDLNTAWNSRTGDLVGAWIEINVYRDSIARELKLTVGHTGKGPKGEDYFPMNPRIRRVTLHSADGRQLGAFDLDIDNRGLQSIPLPGLSGTFRLKIADIVKGSKASWREACISELEVWGTPPAGTQLPGTRHPIVTEEPPASIEKLCETLVPDPDPAYPECTIEMNGSEVDPPWYGAGVIHHVTHRTEHHGHLYGETIEESIVLVVNSRSFVGPKINDTSFSDDGAGNKESPTSTTVTDVFTANAIPGGAQELVITYRIEGSDPAAAIQSYEDFMIVCATDRTCSAPLATGTQDWAVNTKVEPNAIVRTRATGSPPATALGRTPLAL